MSGRQMPIALREGFVFVIAEPHNHFGFALGFSPIEVGGGVIDRVASQDDKGFDLTTIESLCEFANGAFLFLRRIVEYDGFSQVSECRIHGMGQNVDAQGLAVASYDEGLATISQKIRGAFGNPLRIDTSGR